MRRRWVERPLICSTRCGALGKHLVEDGQPIVCPICGGPAERWIATPSSPTVQDDGLWGGAQLVHNIGPEPIFVRTKSEYRALLAAHGLRQKVRHVPMPGTDKSPVTQTWDIGLPPGVDPRPYCMLRPEEQAVRRADAAARLGFTVDELEAISRDLAKLPDTRDAYGNLVARYEPVGLSPAEANAEIRAAQDRSRG